MRALAIALAVLGVLAAGWVSLRRLFTACRGAPARVIAGIVLGVVLASTGIAWLFASARYSIGTDVAVFCFPIPCAAAIGEKAAWSDYASPIAPLVAFIDALLGVSLVVIVGSLIVRRWVRPGA